MPHPELEFFLLLIVQDFYRSIASLDHPHLGESVNRQPPSFSREQLIGTLYDLFRCGDIAARRHDETGGRREFQPTIDEIDAALCAALPLSYGLTPQGGARWEAMSGFDWQYYIGHGFDGGLEGGSRDALETYISRVGWKTMLPGTEKWRAVRPWKATYWKTLPEGVRVRYRETDGELAEPLDYLATGDLWSPGWNRHRLAEMQKYAPMGPSRKETVVANGWRAEFRSVAKRGTHELPVLLDHSDSLVQYAAGMRLAQFGDSTHTRLLLDWFQKRRRRWTLRPISLIRDPHALTVLIEAFEKEQCEDHLRDSTFGRDLGRAIGAFGKEAVLRLAPFLWAGNIQMQVAVLEALATTSSEAAGSLILEWLASLTPDRSGERYRQVSQGLLSLAKLKELRALPLLASIIDRDPDYAIEPLVLFDLPGTWGMLEEFIRSGASIHERYSAASHMAAANPAHLDECKQLKREAQAEWLRHQTSSLVTGDHRAAIDDPVAALVGLLRDSDARRRVAATTLICQHQGPFPREPIIELLSDPVPEVRANAVFALGLCGSIEDLGKVSPLLKDRAGVVRYCANEAIDQLSIVRGNAE